MAAAPITSYTVTPYIGATAQTPKTVTGTPPATSTTVTGLDQRDRLHVPRQGNQRHRHRQRLRSIQRDHARGTRRRPLAPTTVTAAAANQSAIVSWTAPANGGSAITSYTVTPYARRHGADPEDVTGSPPATNTTVTGLTNGTSYTFKVTATNAIGTSGDSRSVQRDHTGRLDGRPVGCADQPVVCRRALGAAQHRQAAAVGRLVGATTDEPVGSPDKPEPRRSSRMPASSAPARRRCPTGRILVVGGHERADHRRDRHQGHDDLRPADLHVDPRRRHALSTLVPGGSPSWPTGAIVAVAGNSTNGSTWADIPEVYDPVAEHTGPC